MKFFILFLAALLGLSYMPRAEANRRLLSPRNSRGVRGSAWTDEQNWSLTKFISDAEKTVVKEATSVVDDMEKEVKSIGKAAEDFISDSAKTIETALEGTFVKRTSVLFDDITSDVTTGWKDLVAGFDSIEDYFETQFVTDLEWVADELVALWDFVCDDSTATDIVTTSCTKSLTSLACVAMDGMGPFCGTGTLLEKIVSSTVSNLIDTVMKCTVYYSIQDLPIDGWCDGIAYSIAEQITDIFDSDPFTPVCDAAVSCACGTCPYTCDYSVSSSCDLDTYEDAISELISELTDLLS